MTGFIKSHYYELQFVALFGGMFLLYIIEAFIPRRKPENNQTSRWVNNITLAIFNHFLLLGFSLGLGYLALWINPSTTLVRHFQLSDISALLFIILVLDLIAYWMHRAYHRYPLLWRIHAAHHSDTDIDVTTSHRQHPFEAMLNGMIVAPLVILIGAPLITLMLFNLLHVISALYTHGNITLPEKLDNILRKILVTPDFHRMHHSSDRQYTDSNYSAIFSFYDHIFATATRLPYKELPEMELGLETLRENKDNRVDRLLLTPFIYKTGNVKTLEIHPPTF